MNRLIDDTVFNLVLILTIIGEFLIPRILEHFYNGYNRKTMVMSVLGSPQSPVRWIYNAWLVWLGIFLVLTSFVLFREIGQTSNILAVLTFISIGCFAVGAGILSGLFSVNESKTMVTFAARIHGACSAIGFMALLFFPLLQSIAAFQSNDFLKGIVCASSFALAMLFFVFFIMGDKEKFKETILSNEGLWERLSLFFMYIPFLYIAIENLFTA